MPPTRDNASTRPRPRKVVKRSPAFGPIAPVRLTPKERVQDAVRNVGANVATGSAPSRTQPTPKAPAKHEPHVVYVHRLGDRSLDQARAAVLTAIINRNPLPPEALAPRIQQARPGAAAAGANIAAVGPRRRRVKQPKFRITKREADQFMGKNKPCNPLTGEGNCVA